MLREQIKDARLPLTGEKLASPHLAHGTSNSFRIVRVSPPSAATQQAVGLYKADPGLIEKSYEEQKRTIFREGAAAYSDSCAQCFSSRGHDAHEILADVKPLQESWAREHSFKFNSDNWSDEILVKQIQTIKPDVLYMQCHMRCIPKHIGRDIKRYFPSVRLVVEYTGQRLIDDHDIYTADIMIVCTPYLEELYRQNGIFPHIVYHGFDDQILRQVNANPRSNRNIPFSFVGFSGFYNGPYHCSRYWSLVELAKRTNIQLYITESTEERIAAFPNISLKRQLFQLLEDHNESQLMEILKQSGLAKDRQSAEALELYLQECTRASKVIRGNSSIPEVEWDKTEPIIPIREAFPEHYRQGGFGKIMYETLGQSKVLFDRSTDAIATGKTVGNMRLFEATGMGCCLLAYEAENMHELFDVDSELVTYSCMDECLEKAEYLLTHDEKRIEIASAGQAKTLSSHTTEKRFEEIEAIIKKNLVSYPPKRPPSS